MAAGPLPRWVWLLPAASAGAAILAWTIWCDTEHGTWLGAVFILGTGVLVLSLVHESLPHRPGAGAWFGRWGIAILSGAAASGLTFLVAGLGYHLRCHPF